MNKLKLLTLIACILLISACEYEKSPWSTDVDCPAHVSVDANIRRLQQQEEKEGSRSTYKVALVSDPQMYPGAFEDVIKRINSMDEVAFILLSGDLAHGGIKAEFEWTCKGMSHSEKPIFAVIGNHDGLSFGKDIWLKYFGDYDFSFSYQDSKFIAYNDNKYEFENVPDRDWLANQVDGSKLHNIAVSHIPPWPKDLELSQYLKSLGVDLTVHGHESKFDYRQYEAAMLPHFITPMSKDLSYGLLTVTDTELSLENCKKSTCSPAVLRTIDD